MNFSLVNECYKQISCIRMGFKGKPWFPLFVFIIGSYLLSQDFRNPTHSWTIQYPANAWSSALYALPNAPISIKVPLLTLSIASFGLWANQTTAINFVDVTSIFWVIIVVAIYILPGAAHKHKTIMFLNSAFLSAMFTTLYLGHDAAVLEYYHNNIVPITATIMVLSTANTMSYYGTFRVYMLGSGLIVVGFGFKLITIYMGKYWGTCIFHTTTAAGIAVLLSPKMAEHSDRNCYTIMENKAIV
jgi:hypothetical protein